MRIDGLSLTSYHRRTYLVESEYGTISYFDWCNREIKRMTDKDHKYTLKEKGKTIAIFKKEIKCT